MAQCVAAPDLPSWPSFVKRADAWLHVAGTVTPVQLMQYVHMVCNRHAYIHVEYHGRLVI